MISFVDLQSQYAEIANDVEGEFLQILRKGQFVGGTYLDRFEYAFSNYLGVHSVIGVSNGTDAIMVACEALGIGKNDLVIVPNNSFIASAFGVSRSLAKPLLCDVDPYTYLIDPDAVESLLRANKRKVKAIMVVDLYGQQPDMERFAALAKKYNVYLIEDAAQAIGSTHNGNHVGYYSDVATTSFYPTKNLGTIGQGGAIMTNIRGLSGKIKKIINQGSESKYEHVCLGGNYRLDTLMAAYLYHALAKLNIWNERRRNIAKIYNESFSSSQRPTQQPSSKHIYHLYEFCCADNEERKKVERALLGRSIGYGFHYPNLISDTPMYEGAETPVAKDLKDRLISLPMHPFLSEADALEVIDTVLGAVKIQPSALDTSSLT